MTVSPGQAPHRLRLVLRLHRDHDHVDHAGQRIADGRVHDVPAARAASGQHRRRSSRGRRAGTYTVTCTSSTGGVTGIGNRTGLADHRHRAHARRDLHVSGRGLGRLGHGRVVRSLGLGDVRRRPADPTPRPRPSRSRRRPAVGPRRDGPHRRGLVGPGPRRRRVAAPRPHPHPARRRARRSRAIGLAASSAYWSSRGRTASASPDGTRSTISSMPSDA